MGSFFFKWKQHLPATTCPFFSRLGIFLLLLYLFSFLFSSIFLVRFLSPFVSAISLLACCLVLSWGLNASGQLGVGDTSDRGSTEGTMGTMLPGLFLDRVACPAWVEEPFPVFTDDDDDDGGGDGGGLNNGLSEVLDWCNSSWNVSHHLIRCQPSRCDEMNKLLE